LYRYIGVWEGIRLHRGVLLFAREHLRRLYQGAKVGAISAMPGDFH
jgi:branched-subunit amino acid aminotransferase/4-amino-4-deoxychorismate lyase